MPKLKASLFFLIAFFLIGAALILRMSAANEYATALGICGIVCYIIAHHVRQRTLG